MEREVEGKMYKYPPGSEKETAESGEEEPGGEIGVDKIKGLQIVFDTERDGIVEGLERPHSLNWSRVYIHQRPFPLSDLLHALLHSLPRR